MQVLTAYWETFVMEKISNHMDSLHMTLMLLFFIATMMTFKSLIPLDQRPRNIKLLNNELYMRWLEKVLSLTVIPFLLLKTLVTQTSHKQK